jgi:homoserine O-acetyltransferase
MPETRHRAGRSKGKTTKDLRFRTENFGLVDGATLPVLKLAYVTHGRLARRPSSSTEELIAILARDPNWNDGHYYDRDGIFPTLTRHRVDTLKLYGIDRELAARFPDPVERESEIRRQAQAWARIFDANALVVLRRASNRYDVTTRLDQTRAKILYVLSRTDRIFPPPLAAEFMPMFKRAGLDAEYIELDTEFGHSCGPDEAPQWAVQLRRFMRSLQP